MAKKIIFYSSPGLALFPHCTTKDMDGKFASKKYSCQLTYQTPEDAAKDRARLESFLKQFTFTKSTPKVPLRTNDRGEVILSAKSQYMPMIYDAKKNILVDKWGDPLTPDQQKAKRILPGSVIRLACTVIDYDNGGSIGSGISLQLDSVQLIKKRVGGADGFDVEDGDAYEVAEADGFGERQDAQDEGFGDSSYASDSDIPF